MVELLTQASELASAEGAQGTRQLLTCAQRLMLMTMREDEWAPLGDAVRALQDYIAIRQARFGARIRMKLPEPGALFVRRMQPIRFLDAHCSSDRMLEDPSSEYFVSFERGQGADGSPCLRMSIRVCSSVSGEAVFTEDLSI